MLHEHSYNRSTRSCTLGHEIVHAYSIMPHGLFKKDQKCCVVVAFAIHCQSTEPPFLLDQVAQFSFLATTTTTTTPVPIYVSTDFALQ